MTSSAIPEVLCSQYQHSLFMMKTKSAETRTTYRSPKQPVYPTQDTKKEQKAPKR